MSYGDTLGAALPDLRALAESRMVDSCIITRPGTGRGPWNDTTRDYDPPAPVTVYEGRCEVQQRDVQDLQAVAGEASIDLQRYVVKLPIAESAAVDKGDDVEITSATNDPNLLGRHFTVEALHHKTYATARRLPCVEVI